MTPRVPARSNGARAAIAALLAALTVTGCAADDVNSTTSASSAVPGPAATDVPSAEPGTRLVRHDQGETTVPVNPSRIVVLDSPLLDALLSLGVTPIGAVRTAVDDGLPGYLDGQSAGIEVVGTIGEPNLEAIAALRPDLILSSSLRDTERYALLGQIAPTVFTQGPGTTWREDFLLAGDAIGRAEAARVALADFDAQAQRVGEALGANGKTAAIVRFLPDETRVYGPDSFSGSVVRSVGLGAPDLEFDEFAIAYLSPEQITTADADLIFATTFGAADDSSRGAVTALWGNMRAVEAGCQFDVDDDRWMVGIGLIGARAILADLESAAQGDCA